MATHGELGSGGGVGSGVGGRIDGTVVALGSIVAVVSIVVGATGSQETQRCTMEPPKKESNLTSTCDLCVCIQEPCNASFGLNKAVMVASHCELMHTKRS